MHFVGDASAASTLDEKVINVRVQLFVDMEDLDVVVDLRALNTGRKTQYDTFWDQVVKYYFQEGVGLAADERRHSEVTHMARVISIRDLLEQVSARCPPGKCVCVCVCVCVWLVSACIKSVFIFSF